MCIEDSKARGSSIQLTCFKFELSVPDSDSPLVDQNICGIYANETYGALFQGYSFESGAYFSTNEE